MKIYRLSPKQIRVNYYPSLLIWSKEKNPNNMGFFGLKKKKSVICTPESNSIAGFETLLFRYNEILF